MATKLTRVVKIHRIPTLARSFGSSRVAFSEQEAPSMTTAARPSTIVTSIPDVPGLSKAVVDYDDNPVGPGASKSSHYKNPEYFCYHETSYFDAEIEMLKFRCPQPSAEKKQQ